MPFCFLKFIPNKQVVNFIIGTILMRKVIFVELRQNKYIRICNNFELSNILRVNHRYRKLISFHDLLLKYLIKKL